MITKHQTRKARHESERLFRNEQTRRGVSEEQIAADIREMRAEARKATKQTTSTTTHTPKEGAMTKTASKKNSVTSPETKTKKSPKPHKIANVMPKTRKTHDHEEIVLAVRATEPTDSAMRAMAEAKFGVVIVAGEFGKAPTRADQDAGRKRDPWCAGPGGPVHGRRLSDPEGKEEQGDQEGRVVSQRPGARTTPPGDRGKRPMARTTQRLGRGPVGTAHTRRTGTMTDHQREQFCSRLRPTDAQRTLTSWRPQRPRP